MQFLWNNDLIQQTSLKVDGGDLSSRNLENEQTSRTGIVNLGGVAEMSL